MRGRGATGGRRRRRRRRGGFLSGRSHFSFIYLRQTTGVRWPVKAEDDDDDDDFKVEIPLPPLPPPIPNRLAFETHRRFRELRGPPNTRDSRRCHELTGAEFYVNVCQYAMFTKPSRVNETMTAEFYCVGSLFPFVIGNNPKSIQS